MSKYGKLLLGSLLLGSSFFLALLEVPCAAIWPSGVALGFVFITRRILLSLIMGAFSGALILSGGNFIEAPFLLISDHLLPNFGSSWKTGAFIFTLLIGGFVGLLEGGAVLDKAVKKWVHNKGRRGVEGAAATFGIICFFDGLANSLLVGKLFRHQADLSGVSRARLAYIVDTTSAAVACLAFISTWIAYQLSMIRSGFELAGQEAMVQPYRLFFASLPYNYYAWFALALMTMTIITGRDFRAMRQYPAEKLSRKVDSEIRVDVENGQIFRAIVPIVFLILFILGGLYVDGIQQIGAELFPVRLELIALAFGEANAPIILILGSVFASIIAGLLYPKTAQTNADQAFEKGLLSLFQPALILVGAWMLSSTLNALGATDYLGGILRGNFPLALFPMFVFLLGSFIAFTTGTSWGTMGILMPLAIPLCFEIYSIESVNTILPVVIGAVFSGAVFGDHCSPISDTTIVSSIASGIDPVDHVRTQLPYALIAGLGASLFGFFPAAILPFGIINLIVSGVVFLFLTFLLLKSPKFGDN